MNQEIRKQKNIIVILVITLILIMGGTYAWFHINIFSNNSNLVKAGTLKLTLVDCQNNILLENAIPISDTKGISQENVCTFTLKNTGSISANYSIYLEDLDLEDNEVRMEDKYVKYNLKQGNNNSTELLSNQTNRIIDEGTIAGSEEKTYELRVWISSTADINAMGKIFYSHLKVNVEQQKNVLPASTWFWANPNLDYEMEYVTNQEKRESAIDHLASVGINTVYINIPTNISYEDFMNTYDNFIQYANSKNIKVYLLDGDPSSILESNYKITIDDRFDLIEKYNSENDSTIEGMHYDIEFYGNSSDDFGLGLWIDGQSEEAKKSPRRLAYINYAKYAYQYAKKKNLKVEYDVTHELSKFTYYDESNTENNMMEQLLNYSDKLTVMYYVTMQKYITTNNFLTMTGSFRFDNGEETTVDKSTISYINDAHKNYNIATELSSFRKDYQKANNCSKSYVNELVPTYIDTDLANTKNMQEYLKSYYTLQLNEIDKYQKENDMTSKYQIAYHDVWELLYVTGYPETQVIKNRIDTFNNDTIKNCQ